MQCIGFYKVDFWKSALFILIGKAARFAVWVILYINYGDTFINWIHLHWNLLLKLKFYIFCSPKAAGSYRSSTKIVRYGVMAALLILVPANKFESWYLNSLF